MVKFAWSNIVTTIEWGNVETAQWGGNPILNRLQSIIFSEGIQEMFYLTCPLILQPHLCQLLIDPSFKFGVTVEGM